MGTTNVKMEAKKISLSRQASFSSRSAIAGLGQWKRLLCLVVLFIVGLVCGHFIHAAFLPRQQMAAVRSGKPLAVRQPRHQSESSAGRPGQSIKKDFSVQFRDYIPRLIFINCGGTLPKSVTLFLDTFPNSRQFVMFSFVSDDTVSPLYAQFSNHQLFTPLVCAAFNGSISIEISRFASNVTANVTLPSVDIASWIQNSTHPDEHIILKLDTGPSMEKAIVERLVKTGAIEWIDQFYTTTTRQDVVQFDRQQFSTRSQDVLLWDDDGNYSDFLKQNAPKNPPLRTNVIKECANATKGYHAIFLYASKISYNLNITLALLTELRKTFPNKLPMELFLPYDYVLCYPEHLESIFDVINTGAYVGGTHKVGDNVTENTTYLQLRNQLVTIENRFSDAKRPLQNVLARGGIDKTILTKLISERNYNVFVGTVDITNIRWENIQQMPELPNIPDLRILSIDISEPNSELLVLHLFRQRGYKILPLADCLN